MRMPRGRSKLSTETRRESKPRDPIALDSFFRPVSLAIGHSDEHFRNPEWQQQDLPR